MLRRAPLEYGVWSMVHRPALTYPPLLGSPSGRAILCVAPFSRGQCVGMSAPLLVVLNASFVGDTYPFRTLSGRPFQHWVRSEAG